MHAARQTHIMLNIMMLEWPAYACICWNALHMHLQSQHCNVPKQLHFSRCMQTADNKQQLLVLLCTLSVGEGALLASLDGLPDDPDAAGASKHQCMPSLTR